MPRYGFVPARERALRLCRRMEDVRLSLEAADHS